MRYLDAPPKLSPAITKATVTVELEDGTTVTYEMAAPRAFLVKSDFPDPAYELFGGQDMLGYIDVPEVPRAYPVQLAFVLGYPVMPRPAIATMRTTPAEASAERPA